MSRLRPVRVDVGVPESVIWMGFGGLEIVPFVLDWVRQPPAIDACLVIGGQTATPEQCAAIVNNPQAPRRRVASRPGHASAHRPRRR